MDKVKKIERHPIILSEHSVALLRIYTRHDFLEDLWTADVDIKSELPFKNSAKQFISQLENNYCDEFLKQLSLEAIRIYTKNRRDVKDLKSVKDIEKEIIKILE